MTRSPLTAARRGGAIALCASWVLVCLAACAPEETPPAAPPSGTTAIGEAASGGTHAAPFAGQTLRLMTHDSFAVSDAVLAAFEAETGAKVQVLQSGDAGTMLNQAILAKGAPLADLLYGVDNSFLSRALAEDIFEPYEAPALAAIPAGLKLDPGNRALPVDTADVCLNVDKRWFAERGLAPPAGLEDLAQDPYRSLLVVPNPASSSPGLAFLLTTIGAYGEEGYLDYWRRLVANDLLVVNDWETAYNTEFSGGPGAGARPIVVSYSSSPAFEVLYGGGVKEPGSAAITADGSCFRQVELVGILAGTPRRALAERWVDFMLGPTFQADMPEQMFVFPVLPGVPLGEVFTRFLVNPERPAELDPERIASQREAWLAAWTDAVLR